MKAALSILILLAAPLALAQSAPAPSCSAPAATAFDIATVKPSTQSDGGSSIRTRPDLIATSGTASNMIEFAYNLRDFQLSGGPGWLATAAWDVVAKVDQPPADWSTLSNDARNSIERQRLQAVLAQRFALKCHFETKELPVYNLVVAKSGSKLTPTAADAQKKYAASTHGENRRIRVEANGIPMDFLVANLSQTLGRTVIDKTGLTGLYDFTLTYTSDPDAGSPASAPATDSDAASGPSLFTAVEEQLGLKLESSRGPVPILVIDSITRPSEN